MKDLPKIHLCFYKCLYTRIGLLTTEGETVAESTFGIATVRGIKTTKFSQVVDCVNHVEKVDTCNKVLDLDQCFSPLINVKK